MFRIIKKDEPKRKVQLGKVIEKFIVKKDTVIEVEYDPKHVPVVLLFQGE